MKLTNPKTKDGLDYSGLLGLENAVFCKGRLKGKNEIKLPDHWKKLIDEHNITVHLTPVGASQELVVRGIQDNAVVLKEKPGIPIDCYYLVIATLQEGVVGVESEE